MHLLITHRWLPGAAFRKAPYHMRRKAWVAGSINPQNCPIANEGCLSSEGARGPGRSVKLMAGRA